MDRLKGIEEAVIHLVYDDVSILEKIVNLFKI